MTDLDRDVERLNDQEGVVAYVRRAPGIAVLVGLFVLAGLLHLFAAVGLFLGAGVEDAVYGTFPWLSNFVDEATFMALGTTVGAILLLIAVLDFVVAWALWDLRSWAWGGALALSILELFVVPAGLIVGILRIVYLSMRDVRASYDEDLYRRRYAGNRLRRVS